MVSIIVVADVLYRAFRQYYEQAVWRKDVVAKDAFDGASFLRKRSVDSVDELVRLLRDLADQNHLLAHVAVLLSEEEGLGVEDVFRAKHLNYLELGLLNVRGLYPVII